MTEQEINNEVERLARSHATADRIAAFVFANVPGITPEAARTIGDQWFEWAKTNATTVTIKEKSSVEFFNAELTRLRELYELRTSIFPNLADEIDCPA